MKIKKITKLDIMYPECDITTKNQNFFVKVLNKYILIHNSPAAVFGYNKDNRFFVSTKSVFNKTPKLAYTESDIETMFSSPGLQEKLKAALKFLPKIVKSGTYQGDIMFTYNDKKKQIIDGEPCITFTPNTITYAIPDDGSELANSVKRAKLGIVIHTQYVGGSFENMSFNVDRSQFGNNPNVWVKDALLTDESARVNFNDKEITDIEIQTAQLEDMSGKLSPKFFNEMKELGLDILMKTWTNSLVRSNTTVKNPEQGNQLFVKFVQNYLQNEIDSVKKEKSKAKRKAIMDKILAFLKKFAKQVLTLFNVNIILTNIKEIIINKFKQIKGLGTFLQKGADFEVIGPEGFCVVDNDGSILKLVSRYSFSQANFLMSKNRMK